MKGKLLLQKLLWMMFLIVPVIAYSQTTDEQLADQYFADGDFDKAAVIYSKLYDKQPTNKHYKEYYQTLLALKHYDDAEKLVKKQQKKNINDLTLFVDLGHIYLLQQNTSAADKQFQNAIDNEYADEGQVNKLANAFIAINKNQLAISAYLKGKKVFNDDSKFNYELAQQYQLMSDVTDAVSSYLDILKYHSQPVVFVENQLQDFLSDKTYQTELQVQLLKRIQKETDNADYAELLIWQFIQRKDFASAYIQVKALDKRNHEGGQRIFEFAQSAYTEGYYDVAIDAYNYLITEKGKNSPLYVAAKSNLLLTQQTKISVDPNYSQTDLLSLETNYKSYISELGWSNYTLSTIRDYASLEAKYFHRLDTAINIINKVLTTIPAGDKETLGYCKLDLGDYQLMHGDIWDATLTYGQVDLDFGDAVIGEEARYRNAKWAYFTGDFDLAQSEMDVLKSATSELVSNDAIALSVFITDNLGLDTTPIPMQMFAAADLDVYQNKLDDALQQLTVLGNIYPKGFLADDILFAKANIYLQKHDYQTAADLFKQVDDQYSTDLLGDDALFQLAQLYDLYLHNTDKASELYKQILTKYKGSIYVIEARKRFRELRGDDLQ